MTRYKIKNDFDMYSLRGFGYEYVGSYYRGDNWMKVKISQKLWNGHNI